MANNSSPTRMGTQIPSTNQTMNTQFCVSEGSSKNLRAKRVYLRRIVEEQLVPPSGFDFIRDKGEVLAGIPAEKENGEGARCRNVIKPVWFGAGWSEGGRTDWKVTEGPKRNRTTAKDEKKREKGSVVKARGGGGQRAEPAN